MNGDRRLFARAFRVPGACDERIQVPSGVLVEIAMGLRHHMGESMGADLTLEHGGEDQVIAQIQARQLNLSLDRSCGWHECREDAK